MQVDAAHVRDLISTGIVIPSSQELSAALAKRLSGFPLKRTGGIIDWNQILGVMVLDWMLHDDAQTLAWARLTTAGSHKLAVLLYNGDEPCIVGDFADVMRNLDTLIWTAPGARILFGADGEVDTPQVSDDVIEFNGVDLLFGTRRM